MHILNPPDMLDSYYNTVQPGIMPRYTYGIQYRTCLWLTGMRLNSPTHPSYLPLPLCIHASMRAVKASRPVNSFVAYVPENRLLARQPATNSAEPSGRHVFSIIQQNFNGIFVAYNHWQCERRNFGRENA